MTIIVVEVWYPERRVKLTTYFPSIWVSEFRSKAEYDRAAPQLASVYSVYDWLDDRVLHSRHAFTYPAYCSFCDRVTQIMIDWTFGAAGNSTSINPAWTETAVCPECGLNSRMRALFDFLKTHCNLSKEQRVYIAEQVTGAYRKYKERFPDLTGSEYLGAEYPGGKVFTPVAESEPHPP